MKKKKTIRKTDFQIIGEFRFSNDEAVNLLREHQSAFGAIVQLSQTIGADSRSLYRPRANFTSSDCEDS